MGESERISKFLETVGRSGWSVAVKLVHVYAVHLKSDGYGAGVKQSQLLV
jgi:hypothetical protein